jgi:hypothetical protein
MLADLDLLLTAVFCAAGGCACTCSPLPTGHPERRSSLLSDDRLAAVQADRDQAERYLAFFLIGILRPTRQDGPGPRPHTSRRSANCIGLERHNTRTQHGLRARIATKLLALAAGLAQPPPQPTPPRVRTPLPRGVGALCGSC